MKASPRRLRALLLSVVLAVVTLVGVAPAAQAVTTLCTSPNYGFTCVAHSGYTGQSTWSYPVDPRGHNCTNYAAYRLARNGAANPGNLGNAADWANNARAKGFPVNGSATVGSIAQWNAHAGGAGWAGHVAYVEVVTDTYIEVTDDNWGGTTTRKRYHRGQSDWPSNFLHVKDVSSGALNLTFIKTANTSGNVEVHWASAASNFASWTGGVSTWFNTNNAANGTFSMYDMNGDGRQDLVYIKTQNTGGNVEVHWLDAANGFSGVPHSYATWFSVGNAANGMFMMGSLDGHPNLVFVKTASTGNGKVELHYVSSVNNYATWIGGTATWFSLGDVANGTFMMHNMDGVSGDDLVFVKTKNTGGGKVELHWLNAATGFVQPPASYSTWFTAADAVNGTFSMSRLDGNPDLTFIKTQNTSGTVEVHYASSANNYATWAGGGASWFSLANVPNGRFSIGAN